MLQDYITLGNLITIGLFAFTFLTFNFSIFKYLDSRFNKIEIMSRKHYEDNHRCIEKLTVAIARMGNGLKHIEEELH